MSFSLSVALAPLLSKWLNVLTLIDMTIYMKKLADFYIGLYCQPGNLGQRSVTISSLFLFILLVTSIIRACMHALRYMHAVDGDPIMPYSLRLIKVVHYARNTVQDNVTALLLMNALN